MPKALARWYRDHLGIALVPESYVDFTDYFSRPQQAWMVNFRVRDLAAMVAQFKN